MRIQNFDWPEEVYECIIGVWCLAYLETKDIMKHLPKIENSLEDAGYCLLIEPVLSENEKQENRLYPHH